MLVTERRERDGGEAAALQPVNGCGVDRYCFFCGDVRPILKIQLLCTSQRKSNVTEQNVSHYIKTKRFNKSIAFGKTLDNLLRITFSACIRLSLK